MTAKRKQNVLVAFSIFLALSSIGFSFNGRTFFWFWGNYPIIPILLLLLVFLVVRYWLYHEVECQRQIILSEFRQSVNEKEKVDFRILLSNREIEVLEWINQGKSNQEIADQLFISISTVKTHINNIYKILDVKNRREAIEKMKIT